MKGWTKSVGQSNAHNSTVNYYGIWTRFRKRAYRSSAKMTNLGRIMDTYGPKLLGHSYCDPITSYDKFHQFSVHHPEIYWSIVLRELSLTFHRGPERILNTGDSSRHRGIWLQGSLLNIAECCLLPMENLNKHDDNVAVVWRDEGLDDFPINHMTLRELRGQAMSVANSLDAIFSKGDAIAIDMPMTVNAVVIYLAIVLAGFVVVHGRQFCSKGNCNTPACV
ncbi:probable acyl-activating enzyme 18, peroxisomal [Amborella trichopoda]|nr:probable acyl-activating enzyme 18, peroxisomal [Amborella trichopoda]|eukprot:XP_020519558.1 probable acyl-activating enzyme 18, peroxisomal [Amborella trichopoda]